MSDSIENKGKKEDEDLNDLESKDKADGEKDIEPEARDEDLEEPLVKQESEYEEAKEEVKIDRNQKVIILVLSFLILIAGTSFYYLNSLLKDEKIYEGISIEDIPVGGRTKEEALEEVKRVKEKEIAESKMDLVYGEKKYEIKIKDLGFEYDYNKAVEEAYAQGRKGKNWDRLKKIRSLKDKKKNIELDSSYDKSQAEKVIGPIKEDINKEKIEATFQFNGGDPIITDEAIGYQIDEEKLKELVNNNVYDLKPIEIPVNQINPVRTRAALERVNGVIGEFTTSFPNSTSGRKENIKISSQAVTNRGIIMPGETVSFNELTGDRSRSNGYKEATVIEEGNYTDGVGGGVCQTSTTLYNALLRADVSIVSRGPHSIPAKYVPYGQDAAVAYDYLDLKYKNDFDFPIYIHSYFSGSSITFKVYGDKNVKNYGVSIDSQIVETVPFKSEEVLDNSLEPGSKEVVQYGRNGYKVHTFKSLIKDGKTQERKLITKDYYRPQNTVYRVGPK